MSAPIRVLLVAPSLDIVGGQAVQAARLMEEFVKMPELEIGFLPINPRLPWPFRPLQQIKFVRTLITEPTYVLMMFWKARQYDIVHTFGAGYWSFILSATPAILSGWLWNKKTILNYRDGQAEDHLNKWPLAVTIMRLVSEIVPPSGFLVDVFQKFGLKARFIYNIVDTAQYRFRARPNPKPIFFSNRGMEPLYNVACTIRAFAIVQGKYPGATLRLAHDGPLRPELQRLAFEELKLKNVEFLGLVNQQRMRELYDQSDIYLMSPNIDNMPGSILECFACGLPFVSTGVGGVPYIVDDERTGLLVPANDHRAMAKQALRLIEEENLATRLTDAGKLECRKYTGTAIANDWKNLYRSLVP